MKMKKTTDNSQKKVEYVVKKEMKINLLVIESQTFILGTKIIAQVPIHQEKS